MYLNPSYMNVTLLVLSITLPEETKTFPCPMTAIPLLGIYSKGNENYSHNTCAQMFIEALFIIAKK